MRCGNEIDVKHQSERGMVKALVRESVSHFQAARDDRDGRSRYRAAKISFLDKLGWYRE